MRKENRGAGGGLPNRPRPSCMSRFVAAPDTMPEQFAKGPAT